MAIPKYLSIKMDLKNQIDQKKFTNGDKFYTEAELMKLYNVSSITVIRALNELVADGYLVRMQGKGTFVSRSRKGQMVYFYDVEKFPLDEDTVFVRSMEKENDPSVLKLLQLTKKDFYYRIERIRLDQEVPYMYQMSFIPERFIKGTPQNKEEYSSIYQRFLEDFHIHMNEQSFKETNEICYPTPKEVADILTMEVNEPTVLQIKKTSLRDNNDVAEYVKSYKKWDYFKVKMSSEMQ